MKCSPHAKSFIIDFLLVVVGNGLFAIISQIVVTFLRLGNGTTNKMAYGSLEGFLIFVNLVSFVLFFAYMIYTEFKRKEETDLKSLENSNLKTNNISDKHSLFGEIEETDQIITLDATDEKLRQDILNQQSQEEYERSLNVSLPEPPDASFEEQNNNINDDEIISDMKNHEMYDYQNPEKNLW